MLSRDTTLVTLCSLSALVLTSACGGSDGSGSKGAGPAASATETEPEEARTSTPTSTRGDRRGSGTPSAERIGSETYDSEELGALYGEIRYTGEPQERFPIGASQKSECNTHDDVEHMSDVVIVNDGKVQYVYVALKSGYDDDDLPAPPQTPARLDQRGCVYTPHVLALQAGQQLLVSNNDPTNHNVNYRAPRNSQSGNRNMGRGQDPLVITFERDENKIYFKCDIHPWMEAYVHVSEHPWFAVTDATGSFRIPDVPPGEYVVEAIHERFGKVRGKVEVKAGEATGFALTYE